ncbi:hypothetical protein [Corynebacterium deserti]|uniref:hypothetical protein n=1 Tax=Corynebacterium deserti TaxID=1408191 RepID=UPI0012E2BBF9|nr:hypothetical protein [Corynebacterium deserti]
MIVKISIQCGSVAFEVAFRVGEIGSVRVAGGLLEKGFIIGKSEFAGFGNDAFDS